MKDLYPYKIYQDAPFIRNSIPVYGSVERIEFFHRYKRPSEHLYIGDIDKDRLLLKDSSLLLRAITPYFLHKHYENETAVDDHYLKLFPKVCWLTDSLYKVGFKFPISVHYNPRIQQNVIHPGSIRNHIIKLFQETPPVKCLYFNTGGVEFDFIKELKIFTKEDLLEYKDILEIELVADHGSIIPHINLDPQSVKPNVVKWQEFIFRRLINATFSIFSNKEIEFLKPWYTTKDKATIEIEIGDVVSESEWSDIVCKCAILAIIGKSYKSEKLTVTHKLSFPTPT